MKLEANGKLPVGRMITVTGTIDNVSEVYIKNGEPVLRKRPELKLVGATILRGGLGALPKSATQATRTLPGTVVKVGTPMSDLTPESAYSDDSADANVAQLDEVPVF